MIKTRARIYKRGNSHRVKPYHHIVHAARRCAAVIPHAHARERDGAVKEEPQRRRLEGRERRQPHVSRVKRVVDAVKEVAEHAHVVLGRRKGARETEENKMKDYQDENVRLVYSV